MALRPGVEYGLPVARPPRLPLFGPRRRPINAEAPTEAPRQAAPPETGSGGGGRRRLWPILLPFTLLAAAVVGVLITTGVIGGSNGTEPTVEPLPVQTTAVNEDGRGAENAIAAAQLGFPTFATKNTTRIGGGNPVENAAAAALATFPSSGESPSPNAVALVPSEAWPVALAAAVLTAEPVSAPLLIAEPGGIGEVTEGALRALNPTGGGPAGGNQVFTIGAVPAPDGFTTRSVTGGTTAEIAVALARLRRQLTGAEPVSFVLISDAAPSFAMPAASWAARSGDPILITQTDQLPDATRDFLARNPRTPIYLLGPQNVISKRVERQLAKGGRQVTRIEGADPVANAIEFARFSDGSFGWSITDPGHGIVITRDSQPLNAVAAAPLSAGGTWGPLLLTSDAEIVPGSLRGYLLDIKPGYSDDPTRALYNHIWLIGDQKAISVGQQATLDQLAELERISPSPAGQPADAAPPGDNQQDDANDEDTNQP